MNANEKIRSDYDRYRGDIEIDRIMDRGFTRYMSTEERTKLYLVQKGILSVKKKTIEALYIFCDDEVHNINDIETAKKIKELKFFLCKSLENIEPIKNLKHLECFDIHGCAIKNIDVLSECKNLKNLKIKSKHICDLKPLENINDLETLVLYTVNNIPIEIFLNLKKIKSLSIYVEEKDWLEENLIKFYDIKTLEKLYIIRHNCSDPLNKGIIKQLALKKPKNKKLKIYLNFM